MPRGVSWGILLALGVAAHGLLGCTPSPPANPVPPSPPAAAEPPLPQPPVDPGPAFQFKDFNVVLVSFDALQAKHCGAWGNPRDVTPHLDRLARQGYRFARAYSVASWTVPASMTWFTGVYPSEHRMTNKFAVFRPGEEKLADVRELAPRLVTLADLFRRHGYATAGFTGNAGVSGGFGYEQGFDVYFQEPNRFGGFDRSIPPALAWVREHRDRKFFLFLHGYDAHGQHTPAEGYDYRFVDAAYDGRYTGSEQEQETLRERGLDQGEVQLRDADVAFWRACYDEKIQRADARFGQFLAEFERLGLMEKTIFVLTSDHGTELYEHRRFDHGFTLYNEQIHVPLVIRLPGRAGGRVVPDPVSSIDLMPTLLDLAGLALDAGAGRQLRGRSLVPALGGAPVGRDCFAETDYRLYTFKRAIIAPDGWKLVVTLESGQRELYDLAKDPGEQQNLAERQPERAQALERRLYAHFAAIGQDLTQRAWQRGFNPVYTFPAPPPKPPAQRQPPPADPRE